MHRNRTSPVRLALALFAILACATGSSHAQAVLPIAQIQSDPSAYVGGAPVTVEGQVYVPSNYRGTTISGYIQDGSGRGINLFGSTANNVNLQTLGTRVRVTGEVLLFFTTVEITNITNITVLGTGSLDVPPVRLTTGAAANTAWEGTFIEAAGPITAVVTQSTAINYTIDDGSGPLVVRVVSTLGAPTFAQGQTIRARGAGGQFQTDFQILVGRVADIGVDAGGADTTPPALVGAWANAGNAVRVTFSEAVDATTGGTAANYAVVEKANPSNSVAVSAAAVSGAVVNLTLGANLAVATEYTLRVTSVRDLAPAPNPIVGTASFDFRSGGTVDTTPPSLSSAAAASATSVTATFNEAIDPVTGGNAANYAVFETATPANTVAVSSASVSGSSATLTLGASLVSGRNYTLRVQAIADLSSNTMPAPQTATFTYSSGPTTTPIATIQANPQAFAGQIVTVQGQVYIPSNYRGATISGYIQDTSGRGINLFGSTANDPRLQDRGNIVQVTGTVELFFTTVEITTITSITLVSGGNPPLAPTVLGTGAAASTSWEGTFIQSTGDITAVATTGGGSPATNYTVNDGSGNLVIRVLDTFGVSFSVGQRITGRGAGSQFQSDFQVLVGQANDVFLATGGGDTTPPSLVSAAATSATTVTAGFNEPVDAVTGGNAANYAVFETATPSNTVAVSSASVSGATATLTLGASLVDGRNYTLQAQSIRDLANNTMTAPQTRTFTYTSGPTATPIATIQANPQAFAGQIVTVQGQVYVPSNYRGATISGYIQDASGRGINLFGSTANDPRLQDRGNIVRVTGTVELFFTTVEITTITNITLVSSGNTPLAPTVLGTGAAASTSWEGTFIQSTGDITAVATTGGSSPATNYTVNDGTGPLLIRVLDSFSVSFSVGQRITGRGAGAQFQSDYQILVGQASDVFLATGGGDTTPPSVTSASAPTATSVNVAFSEPVTQATGGNAANYTVFETASPTTTLPVTSATLSGDRRSATLALGGTLVDQRTYSVRASNLRDDANNVMSAPQTVSFTRGGGPVVTPIATIQANPQGFNGQTVTVEGQVYIPSNYRGSTTSGYIQDASGRGINLFGSTANDPRLQNTGNIVRVTGNVELFFTTVEITGITNITLVSSGNPPLLPTVLSTRDAASTAWEGTYILSTGAILAKVVQATAINYTIDDGSGPLVIRVVTTLAAQEFSVGQTITGRGAGGAFQSDFQVLVGERTGVFEGPPADIFPPAVVRASATSSTAIVVQFNEQVTPATAEDAANYEVFRTNDPATTAPVTGAQMQSESSVKLTLGSPISVSQGWTLRARNIADLIGNALSTNGVTRVIEESLAESVTLTGPPNTFLPRQGETYPIAFSVPSDIASGGGEAQLRIFDLSGRLLRTLFDSRFDRGVFTNNRAVRAWDGRDEFGQLVAAGTYVVHLQVVGSRTGDDQRAQIPVVVATRLDR